MSLSEQWTARNHGQDADVRGQSVSAAMLTKIILVLLAMNALGFVTMGLDKRRAQTGGWRASEARLFSIAILGGAVGILAGMLVFRHKTQHASFKFGIPLIVAAQVVVACYLGYTALGWFQW